MLDDFCLPCQESHPCYRMILNMYTQNRIVPKRRIKVKQKFTLKECIESNQEYRTIIKKYVACLNNKS